ncbi:MAG: four helix bundle protein [Bacteroidales bacterium]|nr:four helix bundle protein [Bacteroidales bacterium]
MSFKDFTKMSVWQKAFKLLIVVYKITGNFPKDEKFGMISDIRRAANSSVHNISEGFGRYEKKDKTRFYKISRGSCYEIISQIMVSNELGFITKEELVSLIVGYKSVINGLDLLIKSVEEKGGPGK